MSPEHPASKNQENIIVVFVWQGHCLVSAAARYTLLGWRSSYIHIFSTKLCLISIRNNSHFAPKIKNWQAKTQWRTIRWSAISSPALQMGQVSTSTMFLRFKLARIWLVFWTRSHPKNCPCCSTQSHSRGSLAKLFETFLDASSILISKWNSLPQIAC